MGTSMSAWCAVTWNEEDVDTLAVYGPFQHRDEAEAFLRGIDHVLGEVGPSLMAATYLHKPHVTVTADGVHDSLGHKLR